MSCTWVLHIKYLFYFRISCTLRTIQRKIRRKWRISDSTSMHTLKPFRSCFLFCVTCIYAYLDLNSLKTSHVLRSQCVQLFYLISVRSYAFVKNDIGVGKNCASFASLSVLTTSRNFYCVTKGRDFILKKVSFLQQWIGSWYLHLSCFKLKLFLKQN